MLRTLFGALSQYGFWLLSLAMPNPPSLALEIANSSERHFEDSFKPHEYSLN